MIAILNGAFFTCDILLVSCGLLCRVWTHGGIRTDDEREIEQWRWRRTSTRIASKMGEHAPDGKSTVARQCRVDHPSYLVSDCLYILYSRRERVSQSHIQKANCDPIQGYNGCTTAAFMPESDFLFMNSSLDIDLWDADREG